MTELEELVARFPGWSIWRSRAGDRPGDWYATRRGHRISQAEVVAGVCMTVAAPTLDELGHVLDQQTDRPMAQ
ncbi:hypothetical protein N5079_17670 [Planotetraspora sp. A-T 1434]|uniref:hypothetical protein n=1 Tax=Planotetraspora sp. A-T 1434 TaxID=2979219 RepID=UPI0021C1C993|nr:hypothetical protein [Planotetraspora sp. A-T 1434]MCT9932033.1 hypothetical protein [Planotetraspora sp. A-T 1434]